MPFISFCRFLSYIFSMVSIHSFVCFVFPERYHMNCKDLDPCTPPPSLKCVIVFLMCLCLLS